MIGSVNRSFRIYLQETLAEHCAKNARYSLRSFARRLKVHHSSLSQVLRGKRKLTERMIRDMGSRTGLSPEEIDAFVDYERRFPSNHSPREIQTQQAILDLVGFEHFRTDVGWISRVLGMSPDDINVALAQLIAMGKLRMAAPDRWSIAKESSDGKRSRAVANPRKGAGKS